MRRGAGLPNPYTAAFHPAGAVLKPGMLVELRKGVLVPHDIPGGTHSNMFVCTAERSGLDVEAYQPGESVLTIQPFGPIRLKVLVRKGERLVAGGQTVQTTVCPTHLVSAGDGTLISEQRFATGVDVAARPISDLDLTDADEDQLVEVLSVF